MGHMNAFGRMPYTLYPNKFTEQAEMAEHDLRVVPGRTYRYYREPLYAFGAGLSLTTWSLATPKAPPACLRSLATSGGGDCQVSIKVSNTGGMAGDCVVMAYFKAKRSTAQWAARRARTPTPARAGEIYQPSALLTPLKQLFDYERVKAVDAGSSTTLHFNISAASLAEVDEASGDTVAEAGAYEVWFEYGTGSTEEDGALLLQAGVTGARTVVDHFPSDKP